MNLTKIIGTLVNGFGSSDKPVRQLAHDYLILRLLALTEPIETWELDQWQLWLWIHRN